MMTHRERLLRAARGEMGDLLPYAPRIDLWYQANARRGALPEQHRGRSAYEISRAEGWAIHASVVDFTDQPYPDAMLHRAIGIHRLKENVFRFQFSPKIEIRIHRDNGRTTIEYRTPAGMARTTTVLTEEMKRSGISIPWVAEHLIKRREDYPIAAALFENIDIVPSFDDFTHWEREVGEDGLCGVWFTGSASPMHHIQKYLLDATAFFFHYHDYPSEMRALAERMEPLYEKAIRIIADSPAEMTHWGGNFDDTITYAPYFEKEFVPWIRKASSVMEGKSKLVLCHCDGENRGLMDLIRDSGMHIAEAVCPYPMTKVKIEEYYRRWSDRLTIFGGVPSIVLLPETCNEEEFRDYMEALFKAIVPGRRFILGVADTTPRDADFDRLVRIGEMVNLRGRLPL
jgi:hypothetical protein